MSRNFQVSSGVQQRLDRVQPLLIDGEWLMAEGGALSDVYGPSCGSRITRATSAGAGDTELAVAAARRSFDNGVWTGLTPAARGRVLWKVADLLEEHADEIAELEMLDAGKFFKAAQQGEVPLAAECFRYYAGWCTKIEGSTKQLSTVPGQDFHIYTQREAVGVAALIVPWNGPLVQAAWKVAPALAAGCSCILKPAEETPLSTVRLGEILLEAGVPAGVFNLLLGDGPGVGHALAAHANVDKISFTGSTRVGKTIVSAAQGNLKKVSLELGGKSPIIVFDDANIDEAIEGAAQAIFSNAGQVCVAGSRLYVQASVYDRVISGVADIARKMRVGASTNSKHDMGPLISAKHLKNVSKMIDQGLAEGGVIIAGGKRLQQGGGYFMEPTVFSNVDRNMSLVKEEIFGPVLVAMPFNNTEDVVSLANDSISGLAASVWTQDISKAHKTAAAIRAGLLWVNCHGIPDMAVPFGGYKQSGWGRENGFEALLQYTELKSVIVKL